MGAGKIPWWARPWPSVWWRDIVGIWIPLLIVGGAMSLQMSFAHRSLKRMLSETNSRLIRVETLLEAHVADDARHLPVAPGDPASGE